jgi:hypothetical protein
VLTIPTSTSEFNVTRVKKAIDPARSRLDQRSGIIPCKRVSPLTWCFPMAPTVSLLEAKILILNYEPNSIHPSTEERRMDRPSESL